MSRVESLSQQPSTLKSRVLNDRVLNDSEYSQKKLDFLQLQSNKVADG